MARPRRVGNDVVDLGDPANAASLRPRFVQRVCAPPELERLAVAAEPMRLLWALFAAKEAAYKVLTKLGPRPILGHRRFVVAEDLRSVEHDGQRLSLRVQVTGRFVHAVAANFEDPALAQVEELPAEATPGAAARWLLARTAGEVLGAAPEELEVFRPLVPGSWDGRGPPVLLRQGRPTGLDVSLSHDGRFVACAAA